jgi:hypothetical protein
VTKRKKEKPAADDDFDGWREKVAKAKPVKISGLPSVKAFVPPPEDEPDNGESAAWQALNGPGGLVERVTGRRPGFLDSLDPDDTSFEELFGYTPGDR